MATQCGCTIYHLTGHRSFSSVVRKGRGCGGGYSVGFNRPTRGHTILHTAPLSRGKRQKKRSLPFCVLYVAYIAHIIFINTAFVQSLGYSPRWLTALFELNKQQMIMLSIVINKCLVSSQALVPSLGGHMVSCTSKDKVGGAKTPQYLNKVNRHVFVVCPLNKASVIERSL